MYRLLKNILFKLPPEKAHDLALCALNTAYNMKINIIKRPIRPVQAMGLSFPNPIGLAAGLDKNGDYIEALSNCGFGFIEVGTLTPKPQLGNPLPRLFRLPNEQALINRMGFNNKGINHCLDRLKTRKASCILGINIGRNWDTPEEQALEDYLYCFRKAYCYSDYITINISSPNTKNLRNMQFGPQLSTLLQTLKEEQALLQHKHQKYTPIAVKIAPDLTTYEVENIAQTLLSYNIDGVIATNTTVNKKSLHDKKWQEEQGGLSGAPLSHASTDIIRQLAVLLKDKIPIIGVGGIMNTQDALAKLEAGACLLQLYTGFIYKGPSLIKQINSLL